MPLRWQTGLIEIGFFAKLLLRQAARFAELAEEEARGRGERGEWWA